MVLHRALTVSCKCKDQVGSIFCRPTLSFVVGCGPAVTVAYCACWQFTAIQLICNIQAFVLSSLLRVNMAIDLRSDTNNQKQWVHETWEVSVHR